MKIQYVSGFANLSRAWMLALAMIAVCLFAIAPASAQGALAEAATDEFGAPAPNETVVQLAAGGTHVWTFSAAPGTVMMTLEPRDPGITFTMARDEVVIDSFVADFVGETQSGYYTEADTTWEVVVAAPADRAVSYKLSWSLYGLSDGQDPFFDDDFSDGAWPEDMEDLNGRPNAQGGDPLAALAGIDPVGLLDTVLAFLARTVFPYLALLAVQSVTIFFVLTFMMRPSKKSAAAETLPELETARSSGATNALTFHEVSHLDEVSRHADARNRFKRLRKNNAFSRWWFLIALIVFLPVSLIAAGAGPVPLIQLAIATALWILFAYIGRPLGVGFAFLALLLLFAPSGVFFLQGWVNQRALIGGAVALGGLLVALAIIIAISRYRAARSGKQDLLVLRVFGMDRSARETFSTIATAWSYLGSSATIADPSYVRFQFSGTRGNVLRMLLVVLATMLAVFASSFPDVQALMPEGLSEIGRDSLLTVAAFVVLIPFAVIPVFFSVRRNFMTHIDKLLDRIGRIMGPKRRPDGYYPRRAFFCHDDMWRPAVHKMMQEAEVLLLDFRGFDAANLGCAYEVGKVLDTVDLDRAVLVVDRATDTGVLYGIFNSCWAKLSAASPNTANASPVLKVFIAHEPITLKAGLWTWLVSFLLLRRTRRWHQDSRGILGLLTTARSDTAIAG